MERVYFLLCRPVEKYKQGKLWDISSTVNIFCKNGDWDGLMQYADSIESNGVEIFDPEIMTEIRIGLFQKSLMKDFSEQMKLNPALQSEYETALQHATKSDWNALAMQLPLLEDSSISSYTFHLLKNVIPGFKLPDNTRKQASTTPEDAPAYAPPVDAFQKLSQNIPAPITVEDIQEKMRQPQAPISTNAQQALQLLIEVSIPRGDFKEIAGAIGYLMLEGFKVVDDATYRAVLYREIKENVQDCLSELAAQEPSAAMKTQLNQAIDHVKNDHWLNLAEIGQAYYDQHKTGLFDQYTTNKLFQYR